MRLPIPPHGQLKNQFAGFKSADVIVNSLKESNLHTLENVPILNRDASTNSATWAIIFNTTYEKLYLQRVQYYINPLICPKSFANIFSCNGMLLVVVVRYL
jgi:hypothetical protein